MTATATSIPRTLPVAEPASRVVLHGISWRTYETLLHEIGEQRLFLTYDRGELEIMAPHPYHERYKKFVGRFIEILSLELDIPIVSVGNTTFRREDLEKGLEPDECYYVQHELQMRHKWDDIDLTKEPPPDLVVEMDYTHHAVNRENIYAALGVPEIWRFNLNRLEVLVLGGGARYQPSSKSLAFPFLPMDEFKRFLQLAMTTPETELVKSFREWVKKNLRVR